MQPYCRETISGNRLEFFLENSVMPRKFLGQRIDPDVDFLRPSSVTLTADDLKHIPPFPTAPGGIEENGFKNKISRKFGGTLKLKKRLESVPELFLHDLRKKPVRSRPKKRATIKRVEPPKEVLPTLKEVDSKPLFTDEEFNRIFVSRPLVMPVMVEPMGNSLTKHANGSTTSSEALFDEIISAYSPAPTRKIPKVLDSEIDRVLAHLSHKQVSKKPAVTGSPTIYDPESCQCATPVLEPVSPDMFEKISSPEYTGGSSSDRWSSGDEFSEILGDVDDEKFVTALNSLRSSRCSSAEVTDTKHQIQPTKLRMSQVTPTKFFVRDDQSCLSEAMHDEDEVEDLEIPEISEIHLLQEKIESIDISSASSSIYSDHTA